MEATTTRRLEKVILPATVDVGNKAVSVFCEIYFDGERLSITGVEGPLSNGNCVGGCGQITLREHGSAWQHGEHYRPADGWSEDLLRRFAEVWRRWHLNDMNPGTPRQEEYLRDYYEAHPDTQRTYDRSCEVLEAAGLYIEGDYRYGTRWLYEPVPADVLDFLESLPDSPRTPAWV